MKEDKYRLYSLVMYNVSPIQAGIQSKHSGIELALAHYGDEDFLDWAKNYKTVILLNGGTSNEGKVGLYGHEPRKGSMEIHLETLLANNINAVPFWEPDMNNSLTSIDFLVDERVYKKDEFPDYYGLIYKDGILFDDEQELLVGSDGNITRKLYTPISYGDYLEAKENDSLSERFKEWVESIGGDKNLFLRDFLKPFRLANN